MPSCTSYLHSICARSREAVTVFCPVGGSVTSSLFSVLPAIGLSLVLWSTMRSSTALLIQQNIQGDIHARYPNRAGWPDVLVIGSNHVHCHQQHSYVGPDFNFVNAVPASPPALCSINF